MTKAWLNNVDVHTEAQLIRDEDAPRILWGDDTSGFVNDVINLKSKELVVATICLPPGGYYRASDTHKAIYDANGCFYVLQGEYTLQLPDSGEVRTAKAGQVILLRGPQLHFGYNFSDQELRVVEMISPPPEGSHLKDRPLPDPARGVLAKALEDYPSSGTRAPWLLDVVGREMALNAVVGSHNPLRLRIFTSSNRISVAAFDLLSGRRTDSMSMSREAALYLEQGVLHVRNLTNGRWEKLTAGDVYLLPAGSEWELFNQSEGRTSGLLVVAGNLNEQLE